MSEQMPALTENAVQIATVTTGIGIALASLWFPPAALAAPVVASLIQHYTKRPERILLDRVRAGGLDVLSEEQMIQFVPMAYRFYEAAKEGEYEHNLRILSDYIVNELKQPEPNAGNFKNIARKLDAIGIKDLKVLALCDASMTKMDSAPPDAAYFVGQAYVSATALERWDDGKHGLSRREIANSLNELASRGLLIPDGATRTSKHEEYYLRSASFSELLKKAKTAIDESYGSEPNT